MESGNGDSGIHSSPAASSASLPPPTSARTLLHYFRRTSMLDTSEVDENAEQGVEKKVKRGRVKEACSPKKKRKRVSTEKIDPTNSEVQEEWREGTIVKEEDDEVRIGSEDEGGSRDKLKCDEKESPVTTIPKYAIGNFFKKMSREEYSKDMASRPSHSVVIVKAEIHAPSSLTLSVTSNSAKKSGRKRHCSNVSRCSDETDVIEVIESTEETMLIPIEAHRESGSTAINNLFSHSSDKYKETDRTENHISKNRQEDAAQVKDIPAKRLLMENDLDHSELKILDDNCVKAVKISKQLFKKRTRKKSNQNTEAVNNTDDSVDFDFLKVTTATEPKPQEKEAKISPQLFKQRPKRTGKGKKVNYDSDSIDVDVLSTLSEKTFGENCPESFAEGASSAFTVLMKKPLSESYVKKDTTKVFSSDKTAEEEKSQNKENKECNNAFSRLMSKARKVDVSVEVKAIAPTFCSEERELEPNIPAKIKKRKRKALIDDVPAESDKIPVEEFGSAVKIEQIEEGNRRSSARISRNREASEHKMKEQQELMRIVDLEIESGSCAKKKERKERVRKRGRKNDSDDDNEVIVDKIVTHPQGDVKTLASIFTKGKKAKVSEDPEKLAARKAFLLSSVPDTLRTQIDSNARKEVIDCISFMPFSTVGHIRQIDYSEPLWLLRECQLAHKLRSNTPVLSLDDRSAFPALHMGQFSSLTKSNFAVIQNVVETKVVSHMSSVQVYHFLKSLKMLNDSFPINKMFKRLVERKIDWDTLEAEARRKNVSLTEIEEERSRGGRRLRQRQKLQKETNTKNDVKAETTVKYDPEIKSSMQWTMKYAPKMAEDVVGNFAVVCKLQSWLQEWKCRRQLCKNKANKRRGADDSFVASSSDEDNSSEEDDEEEGSNLSNTALLVGPSGVGKTSSVYALALQLGFKVLEVNASSHRSGRQVLAQLHEATQSHHVTKHEKDKIAKSKKKKKSATPNKLNKTALILFEDIDVVFEDQDEGFYSAVNSLIASTKRPIVLTTSNPNFLSRKFLKVDVQSFSFKSVPARMLAQYLQLLSLVEGFPVDCDSVEALVRLNVGIVSRCILDLQYWAMSGGSRATAGAALSCDKEATTGNVCSDVDEPEILSFPESNVQSEAEDSISKLLSISKSSLNECLSSAVRPQKHCVAAVLGLTNSMQIIAIEAGELFKNFASSQHLWADGFGEYFESNLSVILPFPKRKFDKAPTKRFVTDVEEEENTSHYKRIRTFDRTIFTTESSSSDEETAENLVGTEPCSADLVSESLQSCKPESAFSTEDTRQSFGNARRAIEELSKCAESSSQFLPFREDHHWWTLPCPVVETLDLTELTCDIASYVQHETLAMTSLAIQELAEVQLCEELTIEEENHPSIPRLFKTVASRAPTLRGRQAEEALNAILPDLTVCPRMHVVDTLPVLRSIARSEERRRAGKGEKISRSGRFLHYLESQDMFLKTSSLQAMCDTFW